jgi:mRNA interferase MazF
MTSYIQDAPLFRLDVVPTAENGLKKPSQVMIDKIVAVRREKVRQIVGKLDNGIMIRINRSLVFWLGLA